MTFFQSPLTMLLTGSAVALMLGGGLSKKGSILSFLGGMCCALSVISGLTAGAELEETLLYVLPTLLACALSDRLGRRKKA